MSYCLRCTVPDPDTNGTMVDRLPCRPIDDEAHDDDAKMYHAQHLDRINVHEFLQQQRREIIKIHLFSLIEIVFTFF